MTSTNINTQTLTHIHPAHINFNGEYQISKLIRTYRNKAERWEKTIKTEENEIKLSSWHINLRDYGDFLFVFCFLLSTWFYRYVSICLTLTKCYVCELLESNKNNKYVNKIFRCFLLHFALHRRKTDRQNEKNACGTQIIPDVQLKIRQKRITNHTTKLKTHENIWKKKEVHKYFEGFATFSVSVMN